MTPAEKRNGENASSIFTEYDVNSPSRLDQWKTDLATLHELLVDANIHALEGNGTIHLNFAEPHLLPENIILGDVNNFIGISPAAVPNSFKVVNIIPKEYGPCCRCEEVIQRTDLVITLKNLIIDWINNGGAQQLKGVAGTIPTELHGIVDDEIVDLYSLSVMRLFNIPWFIWQTWSPINPPNIINFNYQIKTGCCYFTKENTLAPEIPDFLYIDTPEGTLDLIKVEADAKQVLISGLDQGKITHLFNFNSKDPAVISRVHNLKKLNIPLQVKIVAKPVPPKEKKTCPICTNQMIVDELQSHMKAVHKVLLNDVEFRNLCSRLLEKPKYYIASLAYFEDKRDHYCPICLYKIVFSVTRPQPVRLGMDNIWKKAAREHLKEIHNIELTDQEFFDFNGHVDFEISPFDAKLQAAISKKRDINQ